MSLDRSREPDALEPLPEELEQAVAGLRAFVEPTPKQLELSYRRVQQALELAAPPPAATSLAARALRSRRRVLSLTAGGVTAVALAAGFVIGRWTSVPPASPEASQATAVLVAPPPMPQVPGEPEQPPASSWVEDERVAELSPLLYRDTSPGEAAGVDGLAIVRGSIAVRGPVAVHVNGVHEQCSSRDPLLRAECLLRRQQPQRALAALREASTQHERERERVLGLTLLARCQLGQEVLSLGKDFFERWPDSPLTWRIRNECPKAEPSVGGSLQRAEIRRVLGR